jgi:DNA-binding NtrC family response regulator
MSEAAGVLIVDDEYSTRDSLCHWLARDAYRTGTARNGKEALQRLQESCWDVVLLDIRMPGMDGIELQRRMHRLYPGLVVIMITAYASVATAVRALKDGAFDYVTKPIDPTELSRLVGGSRSPSRPT